MQSPGAEPVSDRTRQNLDKQDQNKKRYGNFCGARI